MDQGQLVAPFGGAHAVIFPLEFFSVVGNGHLRKLIAAPCVVAKNAKSFRGGVCGFGPNGQIEGHFFPSKCIWGTGFALRKGGAARCFWRWWMAVVRWQIVSKRVLKTTFRYICRALSFLLFFEFDEFFSEVSEFLYQLGLGRHSIGVSFYSFRNLG